MEKAKYDIFISYRRIGGKNYARTLKPELEKRGFRVFLDFDELKDGVFDKRIMDAINEAPIFLVILSKGALDRCANEGDWVREEILYADKTNRHIVPVEIDKTFREFPENLPNEVKSVLGPHQFSQIDTETLLKESIDKMVHDRIEPWVTKEFPNTLSREIESTDGAEIHIEVDADCDLYRFKKLIKALSPNEDNIVYLKPGKHKIEFVSHEYSDIKKSMLLDIPYENYSDFITVTLLPQIQNKKEEEIRRKAEEYARYKAEKEAKNKQITQIIGNLLNCKIGEETRLKAEEIYQRGKGLCDKEDYSQAFPLIFEAAKLENASAQNTLGFMYTKGLGVDQDHKKAVKWYRLAVEQGSIKAIYNLGLSYEEGKGVDQDYTKAIEWYKIAAEKGYANAQNNLGFMYCNGQGVNQDYTEAIKWYRKAAEQGDASAQNNLGVLYENGLGVNQDYAEAVKWFRKAAEQGYEDAQYNLGFMYKNGQGVIKDHAEAMTWLRKAAEQGSADAQNDLGFMYSHSKGKKNYAEAMTWYRKAADQGNVYAQYNIGVLYENGEGVKKDINQAKKWYEKAAQQGHETAKEHLRELEEAELKELENKADGYYNSKQYDKAFPFYLKLAELGDAFYQFNLGWMYYTGSGVNIDFTEAVKWFRKAAEQGHAGAQNNLGAMYDNGQGVNQDYAEAVKWFRKAAEQGYKGAQFSLGVMYYNGRGVNQDYAEAVKWYRKSAEQGYANAQYNLGVMYRDGQGVNQDYVEAVKWHRKAAEQGIKFAQYNLGKMYEKGNGVKEDYEEAEKWYRMAANQGYENAKNALEQIKVKIEETERQKAEEEARRKAEEENAKRWEEKMKEFRQTWDGVSSFINGYALVWKSKNRLLSEIDSFSLIDKTGKLTMPLTKNRWDYVKHIGYGLIKVGKNSDYGLLNSQGKEILPVKYRFIGTSDTYFNDGYVYVIYESLFRKNKELRVDTRGNVIEGWH